MHFSYSCVQRFAFKITIVVDVVVIVNTVSFFIYYYSQCLPFEKPFCTTYFCCAEALAACETSQFWQG